MSIQATWASDVHLNFISIEKLEEFSDKLQKEKSDIVIISGDIAEYKSFPTILEFVASRVRKDIYFTLGNHDFYGGSIQKGMDLAKDLSKRISNLHYLTEAGSIKLTSKVAIAGHDGWYDGRLGKITQNFLLNDFAHIEDFKDCTWQSLQLLLNKLGDDSATYANKVLTKAYKKYEKVIFVTHVPPFHQVCKYRGLPSSPESVPMFSSAAMGTALQKIIEPRVDKQLHVLCGHTHDPALWHPMPGFKVECASARYLYPAIYKTFDIEETI